MLDKIQNDENVNDENVSVVTLEEEKSTADGGDQKPEFSLRSSLSGKAARIYDESDYTDEEFISMLSMYEETMKSIELGNIVKGKILLLITTR